MDKRKFSTALRRAKKAESQLHGQCEIMASMLQEFFDDEITVLFQESDGFVVLHSDKNWDSANTPIKEVISAIEKDKDAFR
ncbi:hypothetical protein [Sunxiuqinia indica]|uniref:hypothetical protein n=1 Tax=Sunxiuqinia indica TaxID=2692584 RepID=UPI00135965D1|nr:hypothetical protein [Sunxiuqinia indica]